MTEANSRPISFQVDHRDRGTAARAGTLHTQRGAIPTPVFMPVGTQGAVKGLAVDQVVATGAQLILGNTYHLALRPGEEVIRAHGGLHQFMQWPGAILTDSGGFQIFSLAANTKITEESATFRSHIDGSLLELSPERAMEIQAALGSDIAMVLDDVVALPNSTERVAQACERSIRWARRSLDAAFRARQGVFAIVQGGLDEKLRIDCAQKLSEHDFDGFAIGGLSVGEEMKEMYRVLAYTCPVLPQDRPRYLMGVGRPVDILEAIARGVDMFDCVMPTRNGRNALVFTDEGTLRLRNQCHAEDPRPIDEHCGCAACRHSRGYLRHLFMAGEMLGPILATIHNLSYYQRITREARSAVIEDRFFAFWEQKKTLWGS